MKTSLDHLPEDKQFQIKRAAELIVETVKPGMLILFGSYARGDWVEELADDEFHYKYQSDIDLIAIAKNEARANAIERKTSLRGRLHREVKTPVSLIAEDIGFINRQLSKSQYFYSDIIKEGILLHDTGEYTFDEPKELPPNERKILAQEDFEYWFTSADDFYAVFEFTLIKKKLNVAAFNLHQSAERLLSAILLVFTRYKPNTHDLAKLTQLVNAIEPKFLTFFPQGTTEEKRLFELLRKSYVDARYKKNFTITEAELTYLAERVECLKNMAEVICREKMEAFG